MNVFTDMWTTGGYKSLFPKNVNKLIIDYSDILQLNGDVEIKYSFQIMVVVSISNDTCSTDQTIIPNTNPSRLKILRLN